MDKHFIRVTAIPCNNRGIVSKDSTNVELLINPKLIKAIIGNEIHFFDSTFQNFGGKIFTNYKLA